MRHGAPGSVICSSCLAPSASNEASWSATRCRCSQKARCCRISVSLTPSTVLFSQAATSASFHWGSCCVTISWATYDIPATTKRNVRTQQQNSSATLLPIRAAHAPKPFPRRKVSAQHKAQWCPQSSCVCVRSCHTPYLCGKTPVAVVGAPYLSVDRPIDRPMDRCVPVRVWKG